MHVSKRIEKKNSKSISTKIIFFSSQTFPYICSSSEKFSLQMAVKQIPTRLKQKAVWYIRLLKQLHEYVNRLK